MNNYVKVFIFGTALSELIIETTKEGVDKKGIDKGLYATIVYFVCGILGCLYDCLMLGTQFTLEYAICAIGVILIYTLIAQAGYDKAKALDLLGKFIETTKKIFHN